MTAATQQTNESRTEQMTKRVDALIEEGVRKSDAHKTVAEEFDVQPSTVRGAYYRAGQVANGTSRKTTASKKKMSTEDHLAAAVTALREAIDGIDREVEEATERADEAVREAKALKDSAKERKAALQKKLDALEA